SNLYITNNAASRTLGLAPGSTSHIVTGRVQEELAYELTPRVRFDQRLDAQAFTTLAPTPPLDTFAATLHAGVERSWVKDALGVGAAGTYGVTRVTPPAPDQQFTTATVAPRWRRDWSPSINTYIEGGPTYVFSPDPSTRSFVSPAGRASILYTSGNTGID